jgi:GNAT superfamily N-acetyltransferase
MIMYRLSEKKDLEDLVRFLTRSDIDNSFIKPLSQRGVNVGERVYRKYVYGKWVLAIDNNNIIGCCAVVEKEYERELEISTYVVDEKYRGRGIGSKIFDFALNVAKTYPSDYIVTFDSWKDSPISHIEEKRGFELKKEVMGDPKRPEGIVTVVYQLRNG